MKIENLFETAQHQYDLDRMAGAIVSYVDDNANFPFNRSFSMQVKDLPRGSFGTLYARLRNLHVEFTRRTGGGVAGAYSPSLNMITVYGVEVFHSSDGISNKRELTNTLIHELRHALDKSLAGREGFNASMGGEYLHQTTEINARLSSVLSSVTSEFKQNPSMTFDEFMQRFEYYAARNNLMDIFQKAEDENFGEFFDYATKGLFGREVPVDPILDLRALVPNINRSFINFADKKYRRIVTRVYKMYEFLREKYN